MSNPTFDPVAEPGALYDYFRGNAEGRNPLDLLARRGPVRAEYRHPGARLAVLDEQGLAGCMLFPTLGMIYEQPLAHDPGAVCLLFAAFNRWLLDDWGFAHAERIFAAPYLTLADPEWAASELRWALDNGARAVVMRPAAPVTATGRMSPFDSTFDRFWGLASEARIPVVLHAGDSGLSSNGMAADGFAATFAGGYKPTIMSFAIEQAIRDYLLTLIFDKHLERFPGLRLASVENGAEFLPELFREVRSTVARTPGYFAEDPIETFRRHVWVNPFWEDNVYRVVELMGPDRVLFGSDWPHIEALPQPLDFVREVKNLSDAERRMVLHDNAAELLGLAAAVS